MPSFTKNAIKSAFVELLEEYPLKKITVRDIVERCGVNRNSFYYHFQDIPALLEEVITDVADTIIAQYQDYESGEEFLCSCIEYASQRRKLMLHIYNSLNRDMFDRGLVRVCDYVVRVFLDDMLRGRVIPDGDRLAIEGLYQCECFGLISQWMMDGMKGDVTDMVHRVCTLRRGMLEEMINRSLKNAQNDK